MVRKFMLAALMTATVLGGVAPAYAQSVENGRGERMQRGDGNRQRPDGRMQSQRSDSYRERIAPQIRAQQVQQAQARQAANVQQQARPERSADQSVRTDRQRQWQQRQVAQGAAPGAIDGQASREDRRDARRDARQDGREVRRDGRQDARADRQDWRQDQRADRRDGRQDQRVNRRDDRQERRVDNGWRGNNWSNSNNNGRRYDDRTRWSNQRRWDNGWRQDRRYDWQSNRARYGDRYRAGRYYAPRGWDYGYRRFSIGIMLNQLLYSNNYWLDDPYSYSLPPAYGTLRWVRYYDDAMLVDIRDGYVVDVIHNFFW